MVIAFRATRAGARPTPDTDARRASTLRDLPGLGKVGILVIGLGIVLDVIHHVATRSTSMHVECCGIGFVGHASTIAGMVLVVAGVLALALRPRRPVPPEKGEVK